ncbi:MAG TPA: hypothetical protein PL123_06915 [Bacteroidales bacterium]|nr:hypothetical protein [Bacteroidales bacterium]
MKRNSFFFEFIKSGPFILLLVLAILILAGILISNHRQKTVQLKEDVLYIAPKPNK